MDADLETELAAVEAHAATQRAAAAHPTAADAMVREVLQRVEATARAAHRRATEVVEVRRFGID